jgi:hypothetical protein
VPTVRRGGFVAVGEPYWRRWPPPKAAADELGEEWLDEHPDDPDAKDSRVEHDRERYLRWQRELLGWAIIVGRKR